MSEEDKRKAPNMHNMVPEQRLWYAVLTSMLKTAVLDPDRHQDLDGYSPREQIDHARRWLRPTSPDYKMVCYLAGLNPEWVTRKLRESGVLECKE